MFTTDCALFRHKINIRVTDLSISDVSVFIIVVTTCDLSFILTMTIIKLRKLPLFQTWWSSVDSIWG